MTAHPAGEPDLDLLAEYIDGVLAGTPEDSTVAERVATLPAWTALHAELTTALSAVRADLAELPPDRLPDVVAERITKALGAEAGRRAPAPAEDAGPVLGTGPAEPEREPAVPLRPRHRRSWRMAAGALAAGVAVMATGIGGVQFLTVDPDGGPTSATERSEPGAAAAPELDPGSARAPGSTALAAPDPTMVASGTEYTTVDLPYQVRALLHRPASGVAPEADAGAAPRHRSGLTSLAGSGAPEGSPPSALARLADPADLRACLAALHIVHPVAADLARFNGVPALIVIAPHSGPATVEVTVAGPECGVSGPARLARLTVPTDGSPVPSPGG